MEETTPDPPPVIAPEYRIDGLAGAHYTDVLRHLHTHLQPRSYLEIGVNEGATLAIASCASIGVDPKFVLNRDVIGGKPSCLLFQMPSDRFFADHDPTALSGCPVDLAFLDGMHLFEFLLRDFINTERHCRPNSVILLHDCIPTDVYMARRPWYDPEIWKLTPTAHSWTGDVWKVVAALRESRPDLQIHAFDAPPTGMIAITNLNPDSRVLRDAYFDIVARWQPVELGSYGLHRYVDSLAMKPAGLLAEQHEVSRLFWL